LLVSRLYALFGKEASYPEVASLKPCPRGEGVWDILGYYNPNSVIKITICEHEIEEYSKGLAKNLKLNEKQVRMILRELVRLHEHSHALFHTGDFNSFCGINLKDTLFKVRYRFKRGYSSLPRDVNEPITEFIAYSIICDINSRTLKQIFSEVDRTSPPYYRAWNQIVALIDSKSKPNKQDYIFFIPKLVHIAREGNYHNFKQFFIKIQQNYQSIEDVYCLLKTCKEIIG
jgi:hypothetical protein